jgi:hypothetical protein
MGGANTAIGNLSRINVAHVLLADFAAARHSAAPRACHQA